MIPRAHQAQLPPFAVLSKGLAGGDSLGVMDVVTGWSVCLH